jgi:DNA invertase Pin-like site-specific DNA recombinase
MLTAYSYARYSSTAQAQGHSEARQLEDARRYCQEKGFALDESLGIDRGLSGFTGENLTRGILGEFLAAVSAGKVKRGSVLIVENPDRLSRRRFAEVYGWIYQPPLNFGLEIHFLSPRAVLRPNHSFVELLSVGLEIDRSNSESAIKSERSTKAWAAKKHASPAGFAITAVMPAWLEGRVGEPIRVNQARAEIARTIFELAACGFGERLICRWLNERGIPTFGDAKRGRAKYWSRSSVDKILHSHAVLGEYQPMRGRPGRRGQNTSPTGESLHWRPDGPVRENFFPPIIERALFIRVQEEIANRRTTKAGGRVSRLHNLFSGLAWDGNLGLPMHWRFRHLSQRPLLCTASKHINGVTPNQIVYSDFEAAFLTWLDQLDWASVIDAHDSEEIRGLEVKLADLQLAINRCEGRITIAVDELVNLPSPALRARLRAEEESLEAFKRERESVAKTLEAAQAKNRDLLGPNVVYASLAGARDLETRVKLRAEIRRRVSSIVFWFMRGPEVPKLVEDSVKDLFPFAEITFTNGRKRYVVLLGSGVFMTLERQLNPV